MMGAKRNCFSSWLTIAMDFACVRQALESTMEARVSRTTCTSSAQQLALKSSVPYSECSTPSMSRKRTASGPPLVEDLATEEALPATEVPAFAERLRWVRYGE